MLQWACQSRCRWYEDTCSGAAGGGHLAILKWARQNGCSWDEDTCAKAATGGHLAVLQWAHENNCPWDESTTIEAALNNHLDILKWARPQQPPCPWWMLDEVFYVDITGLIAAKPSTLLWLAQQGAPLPAEADAIAAALPIG